MSYMSTLHADITEHLENGYNSEEISLMMKIPKDWVDAVYNDIQNEPLEFKESMDGDFDSAMQSAGFGCDEDYGYFGDTE